MYIENKYHKWYYSIINAAKLRSELPSYYESHHIIPQSLGGSNELVNLVNLTAREHFICHYLLTKFTAGQNYYKMVYACNGMRRSRDYQDRYVNSRLYEANKREAARIQSEKFLGKKLSEEHKAKISRGLEGRVDSPETIEKRRLSTTGLKRNSEQKQRMSKAQKVYAATLTAEQKSERSAKISESLKGKGKGLVKSEEHKKAISATLTGKMKGVAKSEETKQKMRKPKSEEHKKAISEARKAKFAAIRALQSDYPIAK
jgi:hypothetical protein